jgi:hypothetical protein
VGVAVNPDEGDALPGMTLHGACRAIVAATDGRAPPEN